MGNWESWRKGQGMSIAEIRPYQPGDTIKQIDWLSSAKKSELMTKLTHQEEQVCVMHGVLWVDETLRPVLKKLIAAISYVSLKSGDLVGAVIQWVRYPASRKKTQYIQWFEHLDTMDVTDSRLPVVLLHSTLLCVYVSDFPDEAMKKHLRELSQKNTVILMILGEEESFRPVVWRSYAYDSKDLHSSEVKKYQQLLETAIQNTRSLMQSINGKCILIDTQADPLVQLSKQRIF